MRRIVVATHNPHKAREISEVLRARSPGTEVVGLDAFPGAPEPEETGETYAENALIKARSGLEHTGLPTLADDAGLEVAALPGELGPLSKRFQGEETPFPEKVAKLLERLEGTADRRARFVCWVALACPGGEERLFHATCEGEIAAAPRGTGGFGYDPVFWLPELGCTMAELTAPQKHEVSHRGMVLRKLAVWLERQAGGSPGRARGAP
jgi:XTP/dITP diphosphohydrolase